MRTLPAGTWPAEGGSPPRRFACWVGPAPTFDSPGCPTGPPPDGLGTVAGRAAIGSEARAPVAPALADGLSARPGAATSPDVAPPLVIGFPAGVRAGSGPAGV